IVHGVDLVVSEGSIGSSIRDRVGEALLACRNRRSGVVVEHSDLLHQGLCYLLHGIENSLRRELIIDHDRDVPRYGWKSRKWAKNNAARTVLNDPQQVKFGDPDLAVEVPRRDHVRMQRTGVSAEHPIDLDPRGLSGIQ